MGPRSPLHSALAGPWLIRDCPSPEGLCPHPWLVSCPVSCPGLDWWLLAVTAQVWLGCVLSGRLSGYPPVCLLSNARCPLPHCPPIHSTHPPKSSRLSPSHHTSHHINEATRQACTCTCSCSTSRLVLTPNSHTRPPLALPCYFQFRASSTSDKRQECSDKTELDYLHHSPALVTQTYVCALSTSSLPISRTHPSTSTSTFRQRGLAPLLSH